MLEVSGDTRGLAATAAIAAERLGSTSAASGGGGATGDPNASASHAKAIRQGWRIAAAAPGIRTARSDPARSKRNSEPTSNSPPQTEPSVP